LPMVRGDAHDLVRLVVQRRVEPLSHNKVSATAASTSRGSCNGALRTAHARERSPDNVPRGRICREIRYKMWYHSWSTHHSQHMCAGSRVS
jgi:hypothetical protein